MVKSCKVLLNNELVTVFKYDGNEIQIPSIKRSASYIKVIKKNGNYLVVDDNYKEPADISEEKQKKNADKETTVKTVNKTKTCKQKDI